MNKRPDKKKYTKLQEARLHVDGGLAAFAIAYTRTAGEPGKSPAQKLVMPVGPEPRRELHELEMGAGRPETWKKTEKLHLSKVIQRWRPVQATLCKTCSRAVIAWTIRFPLSWGRRSLRYCRPAPSPERRYPVYRFIHALHLSNRGQRQSHFTGQRVDPLRIFQRGFFQFQGAIDVRHLVALGAQILDLVAVFDRAAVLAR